jgi:hypothetical protein
MVGAMGLRGGAGPRIVALLLVALVCADVALDAGCEPAPVPAGGATTALANAGPDSPADACAEVCVPDCFCCSRSESPGATPTLPPPAQTAEAPESPRASLTPLCLPVPELPPIALS